MPEVETKEQSIIQHGKHFCAVLVDLKSVSDILSNIDQMCAFAVYHGKMHLLRNSIKLKAPEILRAFTAYEPHLKRFRRANDTNI